MERRKAFHQETTMTKTLRKPESPNALQLLKADHVKVKKLFDEFEKSKDESRRRKIAREAIQELKVHAAAEEEAFYPTVREATEENELLNEAAEEHHVAKFLIAELEEMEESDPAFEAKFLVLAENVRHHIKEEEEELFPEVRKTDLDLNALGERIAEKKKDLQSSGVPQSDEEALVKSGAGKAEKDSSAAMD
jgi:hemerythrin superfamily protein